LAAGCKKIEPGFTVAELEAARRAIPISQVSLMVRTGCNQTQIIAEIERRQVPATIDSKVEESLIRSGARPVLIAALKNEANALTERQRHAFYELAVKREAAAETERKGPVAQSSQERDQQQRKTTFVVNATKTPTDTPEEAYWKAEAAYRAKKNELEASIASQQAYINRMRSRGYHESDLASAEDRLHQYEGELKNLQAPIR